MAKGPPHRRTRIIIADDHAVLRESLAALLATQPEFLVEGWAGNGQQALDLVKEHHPDVLVLDLFMPESDGFEVLRTLDLAGSQVASVVLSGSANDHDTATSGYVLSSDIVVTRVRF